jgi:thymidine kinase
MRLNKGNAYFEVVAGPMFSGKTREMHRQYKIFKVCNYKIQVFRRDIDTRYGEKEVKTHDGIEFDKEDVFLVKDSDGIKKQLAPDTNVIMIEEGMLYDKGLVEAVDQWVKEGKIVIVTTLPTDYAGNVFGIAGDLMAKADFVTSLSARCMHQENGVYCLDTATKTSRIIPDKQQVIIGGIGAYEARCRKHHHVLGEDGEN